MTTHYRIQVGGDIIDFEGPDNLSDKEIEQLGDTHLRTAKPGQQFPHVQYTGSTTDTAAPAAHPGVIKSWMRNLPHDAAFNWDDEISAAGNAAIPGLAGLENFTGLGDSPQQSMYGDKSKGFWDTFQQNMRLISRSAKPTIK